MALNINPRNPRVLIGILGKFAFSADVAISPGLFMFFKVFLNREIDFSIKKSISGFRKKRKKLGKTWTNSKIGRKRKFT